VATSPGTSSGLKMIVDGQQRLTSLYSVIKGREVVTAENDVKPIVISFNPLTEEFAVANAATGKDPEWLTSISELWTNTTGTFGFINEFVATLRESRELTNDEEREISNNLGRLENLGNYQFSALELSSDLEIDEVAEVFVRINSKGVGLNSADFILTLMSVYEKDARDRLEDFSIASKQPSAGDSSPYNHFLSPSPDQLLRVAVGLGLKRGVLQNAYPALRGRDPETGETSDGYRKQSFERLLAAQEKVLDLTS
jgi:uncharacterized protein with ParB-like and HNH nuclease domain